MDRLLSAWPLGGGVVISDDGIAYTAAGSTAADGTVVAAVDDREFAIGDEVATVCGLDVTQGDAVEAHAGRPHAVPDGELVSQDLAVAPLGDEQVSLVLQILAAAEAEGQAELDPLVVHQVFELWFKLVLRELRLARDQLAERLASQHAITLEVRPDVVDQIAQPRIGLLVDLARQTDADLRAVVAAQ